MSNAHPIILKICNLYHRDAQARGIPMDHTEWNRTGSFQYFGYIDRTRRADGFPVFIKCGVVGQ